jgi:hypothetical protein
MRLRIWQQSAGQGIEITSDAQAKIVLVPNVVLRIFQVARECPETALSSGRPGIFTLATAFFIISLTLRSQMAQSRHVL